MWAHKVLRGGLAVSRKAPHRQPTALRQHACTKARGTCAGNFDLSSVPVFQCSQRLPPPLERPQPRCSPPAPPPPRVRSKKPRGLLCPAADHQGLLGCFEQIPGLFIIQSRTASACRAMKEFIILRATCISGSSAGPRPPLPRSPRLRLASEHLCRQRPPAAGGNRGLGIRGHPAPPGPS